MIVGMEPQRAWWLRWRVIWGVLNCYRLLRIKMPVLTFELLSGDPISELVIEFGATDIVKGCPGRSCKLLF